MKGQTMTHPELITNLWLFAQAIWKCALLTGIGPGIAIILFLEWRQRMKVTLESTSKVVSISTGYHEAMECRVWEGVTERGVKVQCLIPRIAVALGEDHAQFEAELKEQRAPSAEVSAFPMRMVL